MRNLLMLFVTGVALFVMGCSGQGNNLIAPDTPQMETRRGSHHMLWGLWRFTADPKARSLDVTRLRVPESHLNVLPFLEPPPLLNLTLDDLEFDGNTIIADIGLRHPFLGLDEFTGFDVRGILITNGSKSDFSDPDIVMTGPGDTRLLNADGHTRWWNPHEFDIPDGLLGAPDSFAHYNSTINPYKLYCDDIPGAGSPVDVISPESRCVFSAGNKIIRTYEIELGGDGLIFNYAIDASWEFPNGNAPWDVPDDFPQEANCPEAWNFVVTEVDNYLYNDGNSNGGLLSLRIDLWDHFNAEVNELYIESPGNFNAAGPLYPIDGGAGFSTYELEIGMTTPSQGSIDILITAECEEVGYQGLLPGETVTAYHVHTAGVSDISTMIPPVAVAEIVTQQPWGMNDTIEFDASASYDPDGGFLTGYEWDFDGDGIYGDAYDSGTDMNPTKIYTAPGIYEVDVRVTDDDAHTDILDEPLDVEIYGTPIITDIAVDYQDPQKVTWTISGMHFGSVEGAVNTDLPTGWNAAINSWTDNEIVCEFDPYSMDVATTVTNNGGAESSGYVVREANGILIIYNTNSTISGQIKDYYVSPVTGRDIPSGHVLGLAMSTSETINRATFDTYKTTIEDWITNNNVRYEIKYIVTTKGVPLRVTRLNGSGTSSDYACFDSELCLLYETYNILGWRTNPYRKFSAPEAFHPGKNTYGGITTRYITCRLTGYEYDEVTAMLDRCRNPYMGGDGYFILDDDPGKTYDSMPAAAANLAAEGFSVYFNDDDIFVTAATIADPSISDHVMGYCGHGIHHSPNPGTYYIINDLQFGYLNGALFDSYESSNGTSFNWLSHSSHGELGDFIRMGGSGGSGHCFEPYASAVADEDLLFRYYSRGYSLIDAHHMSMSYASWVNVIVGDPLCHIAVWDGN